MAVLRFKRPVPAPDQAAAEALPLSVTRPEILIDGSDREFRRLIHRMLIGQARLDVVRECIAERIGVSGTQYTMLMSVLHLQGTAGVSITALADYLEVTGPHVTGIVGKLVAGGFVRKAANPKDRRGVLVKLDACGAEEAAAGLRVHFRGQRPAVRRGGAGGIPRGGELQRQVHPQHEGDAGLDRPAAGRFGPLARDRHLRGEGHVAYRQGAS